MQTLSYKGYIGSVEVSFEDDCLHGCIQFIDDLITYEGETSAQLKKAFEDAVDRYLAYCKKTGKPANKSFGGSFNVRVGAERHRALAHAAMQRDVAINELVCQAVDKYLEPTQQSTHNHVHIHMEMTSEMQPLLAGAGAIQQVRSSTQYVNYKH